MKQNLRLLTETALLLALLVVMQGVTKPLGQLVTGSCVNLVLAVSALTVGLPWALVVAVISPELAYLLGIAPQLVTVPAIMVGNCVFVVLLGLLCQPEGGLRGKQILGWLAAAGAKFAALYLLVVQIICGLAAGPLLRQGLLKEPMLKALPAMFAWPQLVTALIGGGLGLAVAAVVKKAVKR